MLERSVQDEKLQVRLLRALTRMRDGAPWLQAEIVPHGTICSRHTSARGKCLIERGENLRRKAGGVEWAGMADGRISETVELTSFELDDSCVY